MKSKIIRLIFLLIYLIPFYQCNSKNEELEDIVKIKIFIENQLQAKLPKSITNINHTMISSFMFHVAGKFECNESEFIDFIQKNNFNKIAPDEILNYFISNEYEKYYKWWKPDILINLSYFSKNWEYRNNAETLITVECLLIAGNEDKKKEKIIYYDVLHHPKW